MSHLKKVTKKAFTVGVVASTILWSVGIFGFSGIAIAAYSPVAGDKIRTYSDPGVYYVGSDLKAHFYGTLNTVESWHGVSTAANYWANFGAKRLSDADFLSVTQGAAIVLKPGSLVKFTHVPSIIYFVSTTGKIAKLADDATAKSLFGSNYATKAKPIQPAFAANYSNSLTDISAGNAVYPDGALISKDGSRYLIDGGKARKFTTDDAVIANGYKTTDAYTAPAAYTLPAAGSDITGVEDSIKNPVATGTVVAASAGTLTVTLASDTPASTIIPGAAAKVPFTKVNLIASSDGDVTIDSITAIRGGIGQDSNFASLALIDAATNDQIGLNNSLSSVHTAVFSDDIVVKAGTTKSVILAGNMTTKLLIQAGESPALGISAIVLKSGSLAGAILPLYGNAMTMNGTLTIATGTIRPDTTIADAAPAIGTKNVTFTDIRITNTSSVEDVKIDKIVFDQAGSASDGDVINLKLIDKTNGAVLATADKTVNKVLIMTFSSPILIEKGLQKTYKLVGDVESGSARTIDFNIKKNTDVLIKGQLYGFYITPSFTNVSDTAVSAEPYLNATAHTIGNGTLTIEPLGTFPASNIVEGGTVTLGAFKFTAKGEAIRISSMGWQVKLATSTASAAISDITNLAVYQGSETGTVVAGPKDPTEITPHIAGATVYGNATTTDTITVPIGETIYYVRAKLSTDFSNNDTLRITIPYPSTSATAAGSITATGAVTGNTIYPTPFTDQSSSIKTIKTGTLTVSVSATPGAQDVVRGASGWTFANLIFDGSVSPEDINVSQVLVKQTTGAGTSPAEVTGLKLYDGATLLAVTNDPDSGDNRTSLTDEAVATSTFSFTNVLVIPKGSVKTLTLKGNVSAGAGGGSTDTQQFGMKAQNVVTATGASTGSSLTPVISESAGNSQTIQTGGSLTFSASSATPRASLLSGGAIGTTIGKWVAVAAREDMTVNYLYMDVVQVSSAGGVKQLAKVTIWDGATKVGEGSPTSTAAADATVYITGTNWVVPKGTTKTYDVKVDTNIPDRYSQITQGVTSVAVSGKGFTPSIVGGAVNASGAVTGTITPTGSATFSTFYVFKAVPTITTNDLLASGEKGGGTLPQAGTDPANLYTFKITAPSSGDVSLYMASFYITTTTATVTNLKLYDGGTLIASTSTISEVGKGQGDVSINDDYRNYATGTWAFVITNTGSAPSAGCGGTNACVPLTVQAGQTKTLTLKGKISCNNSAIGCGASTGSGSVNVQLLNDDAALATAPGAADIAAVNAKSLAEGSILWSDLNITYSTASTTSTSTADQWWNGYYLRDSSGNYLAATSTAASWAR